jgi:uncharacterized repeat protein (TIGR03803 family)
MHAILAPLPGFIPTIFRKWLAAPRKHARGNAIDIRIESIPHDGTTHPFRVHNQKKTRFRAGESHKFALRPQLPSQSSGDGKKFTCLGSTAVIVRTPLQKKPFAVREDLMQPKESVLLREAILTSFLVVVLLVTAASSSTDNVLYSFAGGSDGTLPTSALVADKSGNLYGTTSEGGNSSACGPFGDQPCGVVFQLTSSSGVWTESVIYSFTGGADGGTPYSGLLLDSAGNLYGTTNIGGASGQGTVFELTPGAGGTWTETVLHSFTGGSDGAYPRAGLIMKGKSLFGTTAQGGAGTTCGPFGGSCGTVFKLTRGKAGWTEKVLYSFLGGGDGGFPFAGLIMDKTGNLYGTTTQYGATCCGTVFELERGKGGWAESTLYSFTGGADGSYPEGNLIFGSTKNLYGTTSVGGSNGVGTVFQLQHGKGSWTLSTLHTFTDSPDGAVPEAGLVKRGNTLYGTTYNGGTGSSCGLFGGTPCGTVFNLTRSKQLDGERGVLLCGHSRCCPARRQPYIGQVRQSLRDESYRWRFW